MQNNNSDQMSICIATMANNFYWILLSQGINFASFTQPKKNTKAALYLIRPSTCQKYNRWNLKGLFRSKVI